MSKHGKILVAMSGGIDSTIAAMMLHDEGYEVIGITMKTWDYATSGGAKKETGCCSLDSINDARNVAVERGFHHIILDLRSEFGDTIIENFVDEYLAGRTPNPCVLCNTHIKWEALLRRANQLDCEQIATGHYARVREENRRHVVSCGIDNDKDQSYVLWGVSQKNLSRTNFPLGNYHKSEIRQIAIDNGFQELAEKSESYEICFVPDDDYRRFLKDRVKGLKERVEGGLFKDKDGEVLGHHEGYPFYTIGQRRGLGIAFGEPMYVTRIQPETNTVILGREDDLKSKEMWVRDINPVKYDKLDGGMEVLVKIRYKDPGTIGRLRMQADGRIKVEFDHHTSAIAPGQSAVFYEGEDLLGGGFIASEEEVVVETVELIA